MHSIVKRSVVLAGHKTSVSLEDQFWNALKGIAKARGKTLSETIVAIDSERTSANLSSAVRLFVLNHYQERSSSERDAPSSGDQPHRVSH
jgi:predicted DNA-binding ribbon-helix-helix protein